MEIPTSLATMGEDELSEITKQMQYEEHYGKPICFILAKKHSQRLPGKNKLKINKKYLLEYAIEVAKKSEVFGAVVVSSDDLELLEIAYEHKTLLHKRPRELSTSRIQTRQVVRFLIECYKCNIFCVMTPCNPFVTLEDLVAGYEMLLNKDAYYVISVGKGKPIESAMKVLKDGFIEPKLKLGRSQAYKPTYYADGGFIFSRVEAFANEFNFGFYGSRCMVYETPHVSVDIDTKEDYEYAKWILEKSQSSKR